MKVSKLNWDSDFFGYEVAKIESEFIEKEAINLPYKLLYVFSNNIINHTSLINADSKVELLKTELKKKDVVVEIFKKTIHSFDRLLELVYLSGVYSRFRTDSNFRNNEFEKMYLHWIKNALLDSNNYILVKIVDNQLAGFLLLSLKEDFGRIELFSVDEQYQKQGIGMDLIQSAENICTVKNINCLKVATQGKNENALNLYHKKGFLIMDTKFIYHYWNK
jgi:dTDP-4-amino-4,6-dideoxy-D-galactose acyltransferase